MSQALTVVLWGDGRPRRRSSPHIGWERCWSMHTRSSFSSGQSKV